MQTRKLFSCGFLFITVFNLFAIDKTPKNYNETYRSQFHFSPPENKMGSPVSLYQIDSLFHLIFQYNPHNLDEGFINWGRAESKDLIHWNYCNLILTQPDTSSLPMSAVPWWGSVFADQGKRSAIFNRHQLGLFRGDLDSGQTVVAQKMISSQDEFLNCEPFVFWHQETERWVMLAYDRSTSTLQFYQSQNGEQWELSSKLSHPYGFPSLYQLNVDRKPDDTRWVLFGEKSTYQIGSFDGKVFSPEGELKIFDGNTKLGGQVYYRDERKNNRMIMVAELKSINHPDLPSNGQFTFPTEIALRKNGSEIELYRRPIDEIKLLFGKKYQVTDKKIYPGLNNNVLSGIRGDSYYMKMVIDLKNSDYFGIMLRCNKARSGTELAYNVTRKILSLSGVNIEYQPANGKMEFEILIDRSSVEVFIDGGRYVISTPFVPEPTSLRYEIFTNGGEVVVDQLEVYPIRSIWRKSL